MDAHQADPVEQAGWSGVDYTESSNGSVSKGQELPSVESEPATFEKARGSDADATAVNDSNGQSNEAQKVIQDAGEEPKLDEASVKPKATGVGGNSTDAATKQQSSAKSSAMVTPAKKKPQCPMVVTTPSGMRIDVPTGARLDLQDGYLVELAPGVPFSFKRHFFGGANIKIVFGKAPANDSPADGSSSTPKAKSQDTQFWTFTDFKGVKYTIPMGQRLDFGLFHKGGSILGPPGSVFTMGDAEGFDRAREEARKKAKDEAKSKAKGEDAKRSASDEKAGQGGSTIRDRLKGVFGKFQSSERKDGEKTVSGYDSETTLA